MRDSLLRASRIKRSGASYRDSEVHVLAAERMPHVVDRRSMRYSRSGTDRRGCRSGVVSQACFLVSSGQRSNRKKIIRNKKKGEKEKRRSNKLQQRNHPDYVDKRKESLVCALPYDLE